MQSGSHFTPHFRVQGWRLCAVSASQCQILYLFSTSLQLSTRIPKPILHHWWIILIRCCNFCQQDWASWCNLFLVRSLFRSRFQNENLWKAKLQCPGVGSAGPTQVSRTQMSLRPVRCFLPGSRSVLPWRHNHSNRSNLNWTQPKHHEHHKSMQKCLKQSVSPFGLCAFATCCTHRRLWIFLPPQWLWANQEKSHSKKEPMFIKRGWATFCRPKTWKNVGPESYLRMGPWRLSKNITASTARSQLEMEATASKYM